MRLISLSRRGMMLSLMLVGEEADIGRKPHAGVLSTSDIRGTEAPNGTQCNFKDRDIDTNTLYHPDVDDGYQYTAPVGSYPPNGFGLYDMAGNVFEWCVDDRINYARSPHRDPRGSMDGSARTVRGGDFLGPIFHCRVTRRGGCLVHIKSSNIGFRCVVSIE